jgi:hypothetical protein
MIEAIQGGEEVVLNGVSYGRGNINALPSEADLAAGDAKKEAAAEENIHAQMDALQAELKKLERAKAARASESKGSESKSSESKAPEAKPEAPKAEAKSEAKK